MYFEEVLQLSWLGKLSKESAVILSSSLKVCFESCLVLILILVEERERERERRSRAFGFPREVVVWLFGQTKRKKRRRRKPNRQSFKKKKKKKKESRESWLL